MGHQGLKPATGHWELKPATEPSNGSRNHHNLNTRRKLLVPNLHTGNSLELKHRNTTCNFQDKWEKPDFKRHIKASPMRGMTNDNLALRRECLESTAGQTLTGIGRRIKRQGRQNSARNRLLSQLRNLRPFLSIKIYSLMTFLEKSDQEGTHPAI
ncbi:hypothetical protein EYF80_037357 [Liparis tanakae]|uniref:Uncharacterized protein n=1 Tax=Liparis tanakae TaxID=230148 RepID=A0A4Z2GFZ8_9TELE|nr:hypothetical protein EYF80_037357 [Liparis tanakae]